MERRGPGRGPQTFNVVQGIDQGIGYPVAKVFLIFAGAQIDERQDGDGFNRLGTGDFLANLIGPGRSPATTRMAVAVAPVRMITAGIATRGFRRSRGSSRRISPPTLFCPSSSFRLETVRRPFMPLLLPEHLFLPTVRREFQFQPPVVSRRIRQGSSFACNLGFLALFLILLCNPFALPPGGRQIQAGPPQGRTEAPRHYQDRPG